MREGSVGTPLADACARLNFAHSLLVDAVELRGRTLRALARTVVVCEQTASTLERLANARPPHGDRDRLEARAAVLRRHAADGRRRHEVLEALDLGDPRPGTVVPGLVPGRQRRLGAA